MMPTAKRRRKLPTRPFFIVARSGSTAKKPLYLMKPDEKFPVRITDNAHQAVSYTDRGSASKFLSRNPQLRKRFTYRRVG
jgi:hypothetical protein